MFAATKQSFVSKSPTQVEGKFACLLASSPVPSIHQEYQERRSVSLGLSDSAAENFLGLKGRELNSIFFTKLVIMFDSFYMTIGDNKQPIYQYEEILHPGAPLISPYLCFPLPSSHSFFPRDKRRYRWYPPYRQRGPLGFRAHRGKHASPPPRPRSMDWKNWKLTKGLSPASGPYITGALWTCQISPNEQ